MRAKLIRQPLPGSPGQHHKDMVKFDFLLLPAGGRMKLTLGNVYDREFIVGESPFLESRKTFRELLEPLHLFKEI